MSYEYNKQDVYDFAAIIQTEKREKGNELFFSQCPYCHGGKHGDKDTFSINLENGTFNCFRSGCGKHGHFVELARDFGFELDFGETKKYKQLPQKKIETRPAAIAYLESRGIGEAVCRKYRITTARDNPNILVFPFYDENNIMQFVKYRKTNFDKAKDKNKEWSETGAKPILFGMQQCEDRETLVITEGQIDSLSLAEAGIKNAVSVPTGARGFTWYQHCADWIDEFREIIVFGDNENGQVTLVNELQARVRQRVRVVRIKDYLGEKDANDILRKYGKSAIVRAVENAEVPKLKNVKKLSDVKSVDLNDMPKIRTGLYELDRVIGGLYLGQVSLWSGRRGEGKSTLVSQIIAEAIEQSQNVFAYSGELPDFHFKRWLDMQLAGPNYLTKGTDAFGEEYYSVGADVQDKINDWYSDKIYIYDNAYIPESTVEMETLVATVEKVIKQYDAKLICLDNLMTAMERVDGKGDLYTAQSNFVWDLKSIAMKYNVHIMLVAHPRKTKEGEMTNDDISGSGDISNKVDTVVFYGRNAGAEGAGHINVTKNRLTGRLAVGKNAIETQYSKSSKRIATCSKDSDRSYGWEKMQKSACDSGFYVLPGDTECPF